MATYSYVSKLGAKLNCAPMSFVRCSPPPPFVFGMFFPPHFPLPPPVSSRYKLGTFIQHYCVVQAMTTPLEEPADSEEGLHTFLKELNRLQEASRLRAQELQDAKEAEAALQRQVEALASKAQRERQDTLQAELESAKTEVDIQSARVCVDACKTQIEETERQLVGVRQLLEKCSSAGAEALAVSRSCASFSTVADPLIASLRCISRNAHLREVYLSPLLDPLKRLYGSYQHEKGENAPLEEATTETLAGLLEWLRSLSSELTFTDAERTAVEFVCHEALN